MITKSSAMSASPHLTWIQKQGWNSYRKWLTICLWRFYFFPSRTKILLQGGLNEFAFFFVSFINYKGKLLYSGHRFKLTFFFAAKLLVPLLIAYKERVYSYFGLRRGKITRIAAALEMERSSNPQYRTAVTPMLNIKGNNTLVQLYLGLSILKLRTVMYSNSETS